MESDRLQARPALIVSRPIGPDGALLWSLMITSARHSAWPGDVPIGEDHQSFGLPVPCLIRTAKIAALEIMSVERKLGTLSADLVERVSRELRQNLGWR